MQNTLLGGAVLLTVALTGCAPTDNQQANRMTDTDKVKLAALTPPVAKKIPHKMTEHGDVRTDHYYWMRDDERKDPEIIAHLEAENAYKEAVLAPLKDQREALFEELAGRIQKDDSSVPALENGYWYYSSYSDDSEYPVYARKKGSLNAPEEVLLNVNDMAQGQGYFNIGDYDVSANNQILAYSQDDVGRRQYSIHFKNLATGEQLADTLLGTSGETLWAKDNKTLFYVKNDPQTLLGYQVYRHTLGTPQADDVLVYQEDDTTFYTYLGESKDGEVLFINHDQTTKSGISVIDANQPQKAPQLFLPIREGHEYSADKVGDYYFVRTNWNATNFRLMKVHKDHTQDQSKWQDVVPHRDNVYVQDFEVFNDTLVVKEKENGVTRLVTMDLNGNKQRTIPFDDDIYVAYFTGNTQPDSDKLRLYYSSLTTPASVYDIQLDDFSRELKKQTKVLGDFDPANYTAKRIFVEARDGAKVPVSLVYRNDKFKQDGSNPLYQYAYGSYGSTMEPSFRSNWLSLLDRGFVVAIAHIRGGQMLGRPWYEDGKMLNKINTYTDFIDVTKGLVAEKYADPKRVFAMGGSAGGLLMGAIANMAPELYQGVIAHVPFVDVVTTMSDPSIPLTVNEYDEWGNPANKDEYFYMLSYSPYDQVKAQDYPNMLVTTGLHDSQVQYFEPMKWVAKLREMKTDNNQLLFHIEMEAGHGGASGRFKRLRDTAMEYAWISELAGLSD